MNVTSHMPVRIRKVRKKARMPEYVTDGAAGADLFAAEDKVIRPGCRELVRTGLQMEIPSCLEGQIRSRSGMALKHGIFVVNSPGTIDSDYRGEVGVILGNFGSAPYEVEVGQRIAQIVFAPITRVLFSEADDLEDTVRGSGGFGSTGST